MNDSRGCSGRSFYPSHGSCAIPLYQQGIDLGVENQTVWGMYTAMLKERQALCSHLHCWPQASLFLRFAICNDSLQKRESHMLLCACTPHGSRLQSVPDTLCCVHVGVSNWDQSMSIGSAWGALDGPWNKASQTMCGSTCMGAEVCVPSNHICVC